MMENVNITSSLMKRTKSAVAAATYDGGLWALALQELLAFMASRIANDK
jgi:hypothetical protein